MNDQLKEKIKNWFLVTQGLNITDIQEFYNYYLLYPFGYIWKNKDGNKYIYSGACTITCFPIKFITKQYI